VNSRRYVYLGCAAAFAFLSGCETLPWQKSDADTAADAEYLSEDELGQITSAPPEPGLGLSPTPRFSDVPVPSDAREDRDRTYVYESDWLKIGRMVYTVRASVNEVAQFYITNCPAAGWELDTVLQAEGANLVFEKPGSRLQVDVQSQGVGRATLLIVNYTPTEPPAGAGLR